jgi:hypothetical protein
MFFILALGNNFISGQSAGPVFGKRTQLPTLGRETIARSLPRRKGTGHGYEHNLVARSCLACPAHALLNDIKNIRAESSQEEISMAFSSKLLCAMKYHCIYPYHEQGVFDTVRFARRAVSIIHISICQALVNLSAGPDLESGRRPYPKNWAER